MELTTANLVGTRNGLGTKEAVFASPVICFVDFWKAFDKERQEKLDEIQETTNLNNKYLQLILNLYWNQRAQVKVDKELGPEMKIQRGVRQKRVRPYSSACTDCSFFKKH